MNVANTIICRTGRYTGTEENGILCFKGIRYASAERFCPPENMQDSNDSIEAVRFGDACPQPAPTPNGQSEDCLWLNIWTDRNSVAEKKPVMVFIHGGGYISDSSAMNIYNCQYFAENHRNTVFVSVEYRLGILGFADLSDVPGYSDTYSTHGIRGLQDIISALIWINNNIEAFGGSPDCITLFGQSAGAGCISLLPLLPEAEGLFGRMILQSGSPSLVQTREQAAENIRTFMKQTDCNSLTDLRNLSSDAFRTFAYASPVLGCGPIPDSLKEIYDRTSSGFYGSLDMLSGINAAEMIYFPMLMGFDKCEKAEAEAHERRLKLLADELRKAAETKFSVQRYERPLYSYCSFADLALFHIPCKIHCDYHSRTGKTYMYSFDIPADKLLCTCHAAELSYVFGNTRYGYSGRNMNTEISDMIQDMWISFAETGRPADFWPMYSADNSKALIITKDRIISAGISSRNNYEKWNELAFIPIHGAGLF